MDITPSQLHPATTSTRPPVASNPVASNIAPDMADERIKSVAAQLVQAMLETLRARKTNITATYRLQLQGKDFRFRDATERVAYLRALGVSHVYSSPLLKSQSGSMHGYDVIDPTELNDELGSREDFEEFMAALQYHRLGHLLDIVPNHMSVAGDENKWWMDVLKHGPASRFAKYFDIDWKPARGYMAGRVLLPVLDASSGEVLEAGRMTVRFCKGAFCLDFSESLLPLEPKTWIDLLVPGIDRLNNQTKDNEPLNGDSIELYSIIAAIRNLPSRDDTSDDSVAERYRETLVIEGRLNALVERSHKIAEHISANLRAINGRVGEPRTFDRLDALLEKQPYRLVHWKASSDEINYRRFFDVSTLAALSIENMEVFEATHQMFFKLTAAGLVDACRIDHVDGLFDPVQYLWRLQWCFLRELGKREFSQFDSEIRAELKWSDLEPFLLPKLHERFGGRAPAAYIEQRQLDHRAEPNDQDQLQPNGKDWPLIVYVEKILGADEPLPRDWPVRGTTGYDFMNLLNGLFVHPDGFQHLKKSYDHFIGNQQNFDDIVYECKRLILSGPMQSEVTLLASRLDRIANSSRYSRDFTLNALEFAIQEIIACFAVYRTYIHDGCVTPRDEQVVQRATAMAKRRNPAIETNTFDFVRDVLLLKEPYELPEDVWREREYLVGRFQQVTSPVQAKGIEDTAFYRYIPLLSIDEVGGEPRHALISAEQFHQQNVHRHREWPTSMLTTTTHDTKRSEDVRARINVLSEAPALWRKSLQRWQRLNRKHIRQVDGHDAPCKNDQWLFYQSLFGIWPASSPSAQEHQALIERMIQYMEKATHEAKMHTSWISPNPAYDAAVKQFIQAVLADPESKFALDMQSFVDELLDFGLLNAAGQVLIKLTSPGVPDIYQGQELWDFSLVDPDNRRPVDYNLRQHLRGEIEQAVATSDARLAFVRYLSTHPRDNRFKMLVTLEALKFRQQLGAIDGNLQYVPLQVKGPAAEHLLAYAWYRTALDAEQCVAVIAVPRFTYKAYQDRRLPLPNSVEHPFQAIDWSGTAIELPSRVTQEFANVISGASLDSDGSEFDVAKLFEDFPLALLVSDLTDD